MGSGVEFVGAPCLDDAMARDLAAIADDDAPLDWYARMVEQSALTAWAVQVDGERAGTVLWRLDAEPYGRCFVVVAAVGDHPKFDLTHRVLPQLEAVALGMRCAGVRFHTRRLGLVHKSAAHGYKPVEWVLRRRLP
jgi:hypothetical protein